MWLTLLGRFWPYILIAALGLAVTVQTKRLHSSQAETMVVQARFDAFTEQVKTLGEAQIKLNQQKEADDAKTIRNAVTSRDVALNSLRNALNSSSGRPASLTPANTAGDKPVCIPAARYNEAMGTARAEFQRFLDEARKLAGTGAAAQIDAQSLVAGWPK